MTARRAPTDRVDAYLAALPDAFKLQGQLTTELLANLAARVATLERSCRKLRRRVTDLERTCQNDPPRGQGGSTFDPPGPAEGPVPAAEPPAKIPRETPGLFDDQGVHLALALEWESREIFPKKISGEE